MSCLSVEQIYMYLERQLSASENKIIEKHVASCLRCQKVLEERKLLLQAVGNLPSWQVPSNFSQQVMENISPVKVSLSSWLSALAGGFLTFIVAFTIYILATGQNMASLFISLQQTLWEQIKNSSLVFIKFFKVISAILSTVRQLLESLFNGLLHLLTVIKPEVQILIIVTFILLSFLFIYGMRRKFLFGEK
ncbi:MAG: hypothetical protein GTO17_13210 [Candidatus Aminicenantes bacterium]|nr:hypothetical protein [Candidatus Aminicenantes bacterium]